MKIKWSNYWMIIIFVVISIAGFSVWIGFLIFLWFALGVAGVTTDFWAMTEALSTAVAAATVLSAGFVAYRELSESASSRHLEVADRLFVELNSKENIDARRWIYQNLNETPEEEENIYSGEAQENIKKVLNSLDRVAFLTQARWIPDDLIMPWLHPMIVKSFEKLEPYLKFERQRRNEPYFYQNIDVLAERCIIWRRKNLNEYGVKWIKNAL